MPQWTPTKTWEGRDVFIIGGGLSLKTFDWDLLKDECTIGCNDAYLLGKEVCKICVFGDPKWYRKHKHELVKYEGIVFTNHGNFQRNRTDWIWALPRKARGLAKDALAWNKNTGSVAVNLALILGAKRVFLLGFDMCLLNKHEQNWHENLLNEPDKSVYPLFIRGFEILSKQMHKYFPNAEIINVTDSSALDMFPKVACDAFWKGRVK